MSREIPQTESNLSRRAALGRMGVAAVAAGLGSNVSRAAAQEAGSDLAGHPLVGTWTVMTTAGVVPQTHSPDGSMIAAFPPNYVDPSLGLTFQGPALGQWERISERGGRFTFIQALADGAGTYIGTFQLSAEIEASEDGQTWVGNTSPRAIVRDAGNAVIFDEMLPPDPPVTATRVGATAESVVLPAATPAAGTPAP